MSNLTPTPVRVGVMDSQKPGQVVELGVEVLSSSERTLRGLVRGLMVSAAGLLFLPVPVAHFVCLPAMVLVGGPIAGVFAWRQRAIIGAGQAVPCAKCSEQITTPKSLGGWPARLHCGKCGAMVELNPAGAEGE